MDLFDFPEKQYFIDIFGDHVYAVGGFVRDRLLGLDNKKADLIDLLITRTPVEKIIQRLEKDGKVNPVGKSFGVIKFTINARTYDIALPRSDKPKQTAVRGHKDFFIAADPDLPVEKDLERRDFRCNSIALRLADDEKIDPFNGERDIADRIIRMTNEKAFPEDPLRVLRAARFVSVLNFSLDKEVYALSKSVDLTGLSVERVTEELFRILLESEQPSRGLEEFFRLGVLRQLFPELYRLTLCIQDSVFHPERDDFGHHTVWAHTRLTVDQAARLSRHGLSPDSSLSLLLAALYHDVGKVGTTEFEHKHGRMVITSNGHDLLGEAIAKKAFNRLKIFSWNGVDLRKTILSLIRCHHRASELWSNRDVLTKKAFNRLAVDINGEIELLVMLDAADRAGRDHTPIHEFDEEGTWLLNAFRDMN
ncbi:MAG: HD domain-containing protein, partial [Candidatus Aminicenantes bacterium]|nr:HD domain-containing protein [Candidatus Aminicenantes bacterium]